MADKSFGVKDINLIGASGTPTIDSPNNLNINAVNVAISTDITVAGKVSLGTGTSISSPAANTLTLGTNNAESLRVTSDGNTTLGYGGASLYFQNGFNNSTSRIQNGGGSNNSNFKFYTISSGSEAERLRIAANGDIGIATASPTNWGAGVPTIEIKGTVSSGGNASRSGAIAFESGSGTNGYAVLWGQNGGIHIYTGATDRASATYAAQFNSSGNLAFTSGNGIDFSANANASQMSSEILDDYEEGTWTPDTGGVTWNSRAGTYTKVGNVVNLNFWLQASGTSSSTGGFSITGLPFSNTNSANVRPTGAVRLYSPQNFSGNSGVVAWMSQNSSTIELAVIDNNGVTTATPLNHNIWRNGAEVHCTMTFQTDS